MHETEYRLQVNDKGAHQLPLFLDCPQQVRPLETDVPENLKMRGGHFGFLTGILKFDGTVSSCTGTPIATDEELNLKLGLHWKMEWHNLVPRVLSLLRSRKWTLGTRLGMKLNAPRAWCYDGCLQTSILIGQLSKKLTDGQSNLLLSNQVHALDGAIEGVIFPWLRDTRAFLLLHHLEIFSCILLIRNHMIFLVQFGINKHL